MKFEEYVSIISACAAIVTAIAVVATFFIYCRQAAAMEAQIGVAREQIADLQASRASRQFYEALTTLLNVRDEVEIVLKLRGRGLETWSPAEVHAAHVVASQFHVVGMLVLEGVVPEKLFSQAWFYSVPNCYQILGPFLEKIRAERDPRYWTGFDALQERVARHATVFQGFR